jgi:hypothetical protein
MVAFPGCRLGLALLSLPLFLLLLLKLSLRLRILLRQLLGLPLMLLLELLHSRLVGLLLRLLLLELLMCLILLLLNPLPRLFLLYPHLLLLLQLFALKRRIRDGGRGRLRNGRKFLGMHRRRGGPIAARVGRRGRRRARYRHGRGRGSNSHRRLGRHLGGLNLPNLGHRQRPSRIRLNGLFASLERGRWRGRGGARNHRTCLHRNRRSGGHHGRGSQHRLLGRHDGRRERADWGAR